MPVLCWRNRGGEGNGLSAADINVALMIVSAEASGLSTPPVTLALGKLPGQRLKADPDIRFSLPRPRRPHNAVSLEP